MSEIQDSFVNFTNLALYKDVKYAVSFIFTYKSSIYNLLSFFNGC